MTKKIFYQNAYIQTFTTKILHQQKDETGKWYVVLEETAFYPTGGGQPSDIGTLNEVHVLNVEEIDGEIRHYVESPISGLDINGVINWERRFDHMQQHAGQHIISAAFSELFGYETVSFHLGKETLTIDLETEELTEEEVWKAEDLANQIILENRSIETKWITKDEVSQYRLRKQPTVKEDIRLVIIPDFDYNGCGGTHPNSTGEVSAIKILDWERQKKKVRVQFICGKRILLQLQKKNKVITELSQLISTPQKEIVLTIQRLLGRNGELEKALEQTKDNLLQFEAKDMLVHRNNNVVSRVYQDRSIQELQKLARYLVKDTPEIIAVLVCENDNLLQLVFARGEAVSANMKQLIGDVLPLINGKGGGSESMAQGGGDGLLTGKEVVQIAFEKLGL